MSDFPMDDFNLLPTHIDQLDLTIQTRYYEALTDFAFALGELTEVSSKGL